MPFVGCSSIPEWAEEDAKKIEEMYPSLVEAEGKVKEIDVNSPWTKAKQEEAEPKLQEYESQLETYKEHYEKISEHESGDDESLESQLMINYEGQEVSLEQVAEKVSEGEQAYNDAKEWSQSGEKKASDDKKKKEAEQKAAKQKAYLALKKKQAAEKKKQLELAKKKMGFTIRPGFKAPPKSKVDFYFAGDQGRIPGWYKGTVHSKHNNNKGFRIAMDRSNLIVNHVKSKEIMPYKKKTKNKRNPKITCRDVHKWKADKACGTKKTEKECTKPCAWQVSCGVKKVVAKDCYNHLIRRRWKI